MYFHVFKWCFCKEFDAQSANVPNKNSEVSAASVICRPPPQKKKNLVAFKAKFIFFTYFVISACGFSN